MEQTDLSVVTGAFGFTGRYIASRLLSAGVRVKTLTGRPERESPFGAQVAAAPFSFDDPAKLTRSLEGATTLYNTYWVRFGRGAISFQQAVDNLRTLVRSAEEAGVRRIVHVSILNASSQSHLPYFRGKGEVEDAIARSGMSYAIVRPALVFGPEDILINNIAWALRRFPAFPMFGAGRYRVRPVFVDDMAKLAVEAGERTDSFTMDAVGPETYTFEELVRLIGGAIGRKARLVHIRPGIGLAVSRLVGLVVRDVVLTPDEVEGLMSEMLFSESAPTAETRLSEWLKENSDGLGARYASELARHYR